MRPWKGGDVGSSTGATLAVAWAALTSLLLIIAALFSCTGGTAPDKAAATSHADTYGGAACGGECGAACGG